MVLKNEEVALAFDDHLVKIIDKVNEKGENSGLLNQVWEDLEFQAEPNNFKFYLWNSSKNIYPLPSV